MTNFNHSEDKIQADCFAWLWNTHPSTRRLFFHIPNQGARSKVEGIKLQAMGVVPGVPDCVLLWQGRAYGFEFKSAVGVLSDKQKQLHPIWEANGIPVFIVRSFNQFQEIIVNLL